MTTESPAAEFSIIEHCLRTTLHNGWQFAAAMPGQIAAPDQLLSTALNWRDAIVPGTVAQSLGIGIDEIGNYDAQDWWYRTTFIAITTPYQRLHFAGLATIADVWLNGTPILNARNMFVPHSVDVSELLRDTNELIICFRALDAELALRKPRPRWKTALVPQQNMRWIRTTLLGRVPGWTPPINPVGPWQSIWLEQLPAFETITLDIQTGAAKNIGSVRIDIQLKLQKPAAQISATLRVGEHFFALNCKINGKNAHLTGEFSLPDIALWWPHTHGTPALFDCRMALDIDAEKYSLDGGRVGFKHVVFDRRNDQVRLLVNDVPVFCRGACWTINDFRTLLGSEAQLRESLLLAQATGMNMLRIGGTMTYESDLFYRLCDELGIMVWQDFMFANMDYPVTDAVFRAEIDREVAYQLQRLQKHACITVYCGGSEIEQQASMLGLPASEWSNEFFGEALPQRCAQLHAGIPYFPSTPCEGILPIHVDKGISHYYGVGAYRRPLTDVKHAGVKFTSECLGFSNVPEPETIELLLDGTLPPPHHPLWKARQPRDTGPGWDFEDIRDYYFKLLFNLDPIALRSQDVERYYALSRVVTGELMKTVFAEWRKPGSQCGGGLVWFYKDLWPGAGWGIVDSENTPKAAYHYLRRAWAPLALLITDEGLNGLHLHAINESDATRNVVIELQLLQHGSIRIAAAERSLELQPRMSVGVASDSLLGHFTDITYSYRFGPPKHDVVVARMKCAETDVTLAEDYYFPLGLQLREQMASNISATAVFDGEDVLVTLSSECFLQNVHFTASDFTPSDNYFHVAPGVSVTVCCRARIVGKTKFKTTIGALNIIGSITVRAEK
jgi:beta-mannosidase